MSSPDTQNQPGFKSSKINSGRSSGIKLIVICALVLLMAIPAMFISYISYERSNRANDVTRAESARYGGPQTITGPVMLVPYSQSNNKGEITEVGQYMIFPDTGSADFTNVDVTTVSRSLFKVPVYHANGTLSATFENPKDMVKSEPYDFDWTRAQILVAMTDVSGLKEDVTLTGANGLSRAFEPANLTYRSAMAEDVVYSKNFSVYHAGAMSNNGTWLSVAAGDLITAQPLSVRVKLVTGGAQSLAISPFAKTTSMQINSNWPDPGFQGKLTTTEREITEDGFTAKWVVPYLSRGIRAHGKASDMSGQLTAKVAQVNFVATDNPYQTVNRALKYSVLFIGMVFLAYFLFEVIVGVPVHPAQYILIGLAQAIFYLLLLAFAERIGFTGAFVISASATIIATAGYAGAVFGGKDYIVKAGLVFVLVYGLLYVLMRMQDFALMIGALASFTAIAGTMYLTRNINWYGGKP